jgi:hypothetical protein
MIITQVSDLEFITSCNENNNPAIRVMVTAFSTCGTLPQSGFFLTVEIPSPQTQTHESIQALVRQAIASYISGWGVAGPVDVSKIAVVS